ncbi:hypothetical protein AAC03nite_28430 [Alicyclobacillus acidoterrestris]|nr:hypothetical protein AAC03nite_28430 [Alicyclobacillus acidoterrestris]
MKLVERFLDEQNISEFPIDPFTLIKRNKWTFIPYTKLAAECGVTVEDVVAEFGGDGWTKNKGHSYIIAYNDTVTVFQRIRFTLMHEVAHIYLGHFDDFKETVLFRSYLTDDKYTILENEANCFTRNVLVPAPVVKELGIENSYAFDTNDNINLIMRLFDVSWTAAKTRLEFLDLDLKSHFGSAVDQIKRFVRRSLHSKLCFNCGHLFVHETAEYCSVCGSGDLYNPVLLPVREELEVVYLGYVLENGFPVFGCPKCGNEEIKDSFCKICGTGLVNKCTNAETDSWGNVLWECGEVADGNARFCTKCGSKTTYFVQKLLKPWEEETQYEDDPFAPSLSTVDD